MHGSALTRVFSILQDVKQADRLLDDCEAALILQRNLLIDVQQSLVGLEHSCDTLAKATYKIQREAVELQHLTEKLAHSAADMVVAQSTHCCRGSLFAAAAQTHAQRDTELQAFQHRVHMWEQSVEDWQDAGTNKRYDSLVYSVNHAVFLSTQRMLAEEAKHIERHASYPEEASSTASAVARVAHTAQFNDLKAQHDSSMSQRADFAESLAASLSDYLRNRLTGNILKSTHAENELRAGYAQVRDVRPVHGQRGQPAREAWTRALLPLSLCASNLEANFPVVKSEMAVVHREALAGGQTHQVQILVRQAQAQAGRERARRDTVAAGLDAEARAHAATRARLEVRTNDLSRQALGFGEHEYMQLTRDQTMDAKHDRGKELGVVHTAQNMRLEAARVLYTRTGGDLTHLRQARMVMALSLAQYAMLEARWSRKLEEQLHTTASLSEQHNTLKASAEELPRLEAAFAAASSQQCTCFERENIAIRQRLSGVEGQLFSACARNAQLVAESGRLQAEAGVTCWAASEEARAREDKLLAQAKRLKEGLVLRVLRQWLLRNINRCFKAWATAFVRRRQLQRALKLPASNRHSNAGDRVSAAHVLGSVTATVSAIPSLF